MRDIIALVQRKNNELPVTFVAHNLSNLPPVTFDSIDVCVLLSRMEHMRLEMDALKAVVSTQTSVCDDIMQVFKGNAIPPETPSTRAFEPAHIVESPPARIVESPPARIVESPPARIVESPPARIVESPPARIVESPPTRIVESTPAHIVESPPARIVEMPSARIVESSPARIVESPPARIIESPPARIIESPPARIVESLPTRIVESSPAHIVESPPARIVESPPARIVEMPPARVVEALPSRIIESPARIVESSPAHIVEESLARIVESPPARIVESPPARIVASPPTRIVESPPARIVESPPASAHDQHTLGDWSTVVKRKKVSQPMMSENHPKKGKNHVRRNDRGSTVIGKATGLHIRAANKRLANVFVSRLAPDLSCDDMSRHIEGVLRMKPVVELVKATSSYSSFHLTCECQDPKAFLDERIWPEGSLVRWWRADKRNNPITTASNELRSDDEIIATTDAAV